MKTIPKIALIICCGFALYGFAVEPSGTLLDNSDVKVVRALEKPHVKGSFHDHKVNRVMVYLQDGQQRFEYQDGRKPVVFDWKAGEVKWSPAEGMHSPEMVSDQPINIIEVELKKPGVGKTAVGSRDALKVDGKHHKLEFENDQVRVLRVKLGAHESTPMVEHSSNSLEVFLTDTAAQKAGEVLWKTAGTDKVENTGDRPLEMLIIEVR